MSVTQDKNKQDSRDQQIKVMQQHVTESFDRWVSGHNREWAIKLASERQSKPNSPK